VAAYVTSAEICATDSTLHVASIENKLYDSDSRPL